MSLSKPLPVLPHMPWNVKKLITDSADSITKVSLRQCSKEFKSHVDRSKISHREYRISLGRNSLSTVFWTLPSNWLTRSFPEKLGTSGVFDEAMREAVNCFIKCLKRKNISVDELSIEFAQHLSVSRKQMFMGCLMESLESLDHKIHVKRLVLLLCDQENAIPTIISHMEPGTLKTISLEVDKTQDHQGRHVSLQSVARMEQWKRAKELFLYGYSTDLPRADIAHFKRFRADVQHLTLECVKETIKKALHCADFEDICLKYATSEKEAIEEYHKQIGHENIDIPETQEYVTVKFYSTFGHCGTFTVLRRKCLQSLEKKKEISKQSVKVSVKRPTW